MLVVNTSVTLHARPTAQAVDMAVRGEAVLAV